MLWQRLYMVIWLAFFECLLVQRWFATWVIVILHVALGTAILVLTQVNAAELARKAVPDRLKRISRATANIAIAQAVLGAAVGALMHFDLPSWIRTLISGVHLALALTILAQAGSTATAYDMFEEKEYGPPPEPPAPAPGK